MLYARRDGNQRVLLTEGTNVILAKNRYGLPPECRCHGLHSLRA
ncbi:MAG: hypothetical protein R3C45_18480 [Phycisphaerales bacterium]